MDRESVRKAYRRHARFYDAWGGPILEAGRKRAIEQMDCRPGERVLEVGVGTGLSLPLYPKGVRVTGIDLSGAMLRQAKERVRELGLSDVSLLQMDAERMAFPDGSFDKVVAMYVASTVPHPPRLVEEMRRVCRSEDGIFILNHFQSRSAAVAAVERALAPLSKLIGFRPDFSLPAFLRETRLEVIRSTGTGPFGYWTLIQSRK